MRERFIRKFDISISRAKKPPEQSGGELGSNPQRGLINMSNYIKATKDGISYNPDVRAPIRRVKKNMSYEEMVRCPVTNSENAFKSSSILSKMGGKSMTYGNIEGMSLTMICRIDDDITNDTVVVRGERGNYWIVEIEGNNYSISKSCSIFVTFED